ncbi:MAG: putative PEP-binding protein [Succinivibrio sp.]
MYTLTGISISEGISVAPALVLSKQKSLFQDDELFAYDTDAEIERFNKKSALFAQKLRQIGNPAKDTLRDLFGAAAGFITSFDNKKEIIPLIEKGNSASIAASKILLGNLDAFFGHNVDLKNDKDELISVVNEFIHTLEHSQNSQLELPEITHDVILISKNITPAQLLSLDTKHIKGVVLEGGHDSGHLGVVLRELNIPSVFSVFDATTISNETTVMVDANSSIVIVEPAEDIIDSLISRQDMYTDQINDESLLNLTIACAVGAIGQESNELIKKHGLGLLRSEFLFLSSNTEPNEDEMTQCFYNIFSKIKANAPITARTFDFADDKKPMFNLRVDECGPLKGYGANVGSALLKKEIRALLRASAQRCITIVFPLVTKISEKDYLIRLACDCIKELDESGISHGKMELSFMIETPAAVLLAPEIASKGSMMIIGTSSLAEYASAPCPPDKAFTPVLAKMIVMAAKAAHEAGAHLGVAGRFASRAELMPFFYKLGVTYLVTGTYNIARLQAVIERLNLEKDINPAFDQKLYDKVMSTYSGSDLTDIINNL